MLSAAPSGLAWLFAAAVAVSSAVMVLDVARRSGEAIEAVSPTTLSVAVTASLAAMAGAAAVVITRDRDLALLSAAGSILVVGALALSTIFGILVVPLIVATIIVLGRRSSGRRGIGVALISGPAIALGLAVLLAIWVQPPLVECGETGVTTTSRPWWDSSSGSGTSSISKSGANVSTGSIETPSGTYEYGCEGGKLTKFRPTGGQADQPGTPAVPSPNQLAKFAQSR